MKGDTMTTDPQATLSRAAAIIRERGWTQGRMSDKAGRVCLVNALIHAGAGGWPAAQELRRRLGVELRDWNDAPGRTVKEVLAALEPRP